MQALVSNLRYTVRSLRQTPSFTVFATAALALGIGANAAMFSLVDAVLLRPLRFRDPGRLVQVFEDFSIIGFPHNTPAPANYQDWKRRNHVFNDMAAMHDGIVNISGRGIAPEEVEGGYISANLLPLLGVDPILGRNIRDEEVRSQPAPVVLIGFGIWQRRFGGRADVLGKKIELDRVPYEVVGVMPRGFRFPEDCDLWVPMDVRDNSPATRDSHYLKVYARLNPGVSLTAAQTEMSGIAAQLAREYPVSNTHVGAVVVSLRDEFVGDLKLGLIALGCGVACVLLIACANVAGLLLARARGRHRDMAVRAALGASRGNLVYGAMLESLLLSLLGGAFGAVLAIWSLPLLSRLIPPALGAWAQPHIDWRVLLFTFAVSACSSLFFGAAPALVMSRVDLTEALQQGGRARVGGASRLRRILVIGEVALATAVLAGALLLGQTLWNLTRVPLGYDPGRVLTARTSLPVTAQSPYVRVEPRREFYRQVVEKIEALPGVVSAGYTSFLPLTNRGGTSGFRIEGFPDPPRGEWNDANHRVITSHYLQTMGVRLRAGRFFADADIASSQPVSIINSAMARQFWKGRDPIGTRMRLDSPSEPWTTVIGVVDDVRQMGLDVAGRAEMYFPISQVSAEVGFLSPRDLAVRVVGDPRNYVHALRTVISAVDPNQPVTAIQPMQSLVDDELASRNLEAKLIGGFAMMALLLAVLGLYGLLAYTVAQRSREIGVRMALGAQAGQVLRQTIAEGLGLVILGLLCGVALSIVTARLLSGMLYGVSAADPLAFAASAVILLVAGVCACYFPARAAASIDPMEALRYE